MQKQARSVSLVALLRQAFSDCMAQWQATLPGALHGDGESVHQLRVCLRRLRTLLALASAPPALRAAVRAEAGVLGQLRDWQVLADQTLPAVASPADIAAWMPSLHVQTHQAWKAAQRQIGDATLRTQVLAWVRDFPVIASADPAPDQSIWLLPASRMARTAIGAARRRVKRRLLTLRLRDFHSFHRARIAIKKERYLLELFLPAVGGARQRRRLSDLVSAQSQLGRANDLAAALRLLPVLEQAQPLPPALSRGLRDKLQTETRRILRAARRDVLTRLV
ncbi:CHAD domain-containing protein [Massilia sp. TS11]|uniref:CHAD domain-containing protein n=1 Tax=Massilia sp. TS11 TaxID=2908003 RepID=UPI001EDA4DFC|nr:CHAD domain-containing protein [Massilia sp. TS11]MCG2584723.1 CHAD domain-containing protein [Massilia sp. TS11]